MSLVLLRHKNGGKLKSELNDIFSVFYLGRDFVFGRMKSLSLLSRTQYHCIILVTVTPKNVNFDTTYVGAPRYTTYGNTSIKNGLFISSTVKQKISNFKLSF